MSLLHRFVERFREGGWLQRVLLLIVLIVVLAVAAVIVRTVVLPFLIRLYAWFIEFVVVFAFVTLFVFALSPSTGKKLFRLGWLIMERVVLDPLLALFDRQKKKDHDAA